MAELAESKADLWRTELLEAEQLDNAKVREAIRNWIDVDIYCTYIYMEG